MAPTVDDYLATEVHTAAPQKLQLMLIEAALRLSLQARRHLADSQIEKAGKALLRGQSIVSELLAGVATNQADEATQRVAGVYLFVYRALVAAKPASLLSQRRHGIDPGRPPRRQVTGQHRKAGQHERRAGQQHWIVVTMAEVPRQ